MSQFTAPSTGFRALKPHLQAHPAFLDALVLRLSSADHALCANALHLINALMRDAIASDGEEEWPRFVNRLQELGVIAGVEKLMRGEGVAEVGGAVVEFQELTKVLLRRWMGVGVDGEERHWQALRGLWVSSYPSSYWRSEEGKEAGSGKEGNGERWRRLGFQTERPAEEFRETGVLGLMDLAEWVRRNPDLWQKTLLEQSVMPEHNRCPVARASLSVTAMLCEHFEIDEGGEGEGYVRTSELRDGLDLDRAVQPLLLRWEGMHSACLNTLLRLWKVAGARVDEYHKIEDLLRLVIARIIGTADRKAPTEQVQRALDTVTLETARQWQLEDLDLAYEQAWGSHLR